MIIEYECIVILFTISFAIVIALVMMLVIYARVLELLHLLYGQEERDER
jgi:hypothetical protein